ncbi:MULTISPECIES: EAL domain-containing protein [unclassified Caballeronia]|uniref:putative bifunctional diguanylate cyclase/phosphodiesterase n=1 Tax=unclassified Caballeronia TaxID=2646786 RepID=UPI002865E971|nr:MULTISPECIES: EAL domain-containing protein [unclassified Caballeronia]MDR5755108.1 EAL domain-containing protein [Caballeronia sp. LZ024]MDR5845318.1 EAL domain-containing protein [Caballeronia sp. LZ031]
MMKRGSQSAGRLTVRANLVSVGIALVVASIVLLVYQAVAFRNALYDDASLQASVIAENVSASLMFEDEASMRDVLRSLSRVPYVESVSVYRNDGRLFTRYARAGISREEQEEGTLQSTERHTTFSLGDVFVRAAVEHNGHKLGHVVLVATSDLVRRQLVQYACFLGIACLGALWISTLVMRRMRRRVSAAERELEYLARRDSLTNLRNRRAFYETLEERLAAAKDPHRHFGLVLIDLDDFKTVNDTLGHGAGDELLQHVARVLESTVRGRATVSRMGGDEFAVTLEISWKRTVVADLANEIGAALGRPASICNREINVTASVGYASFPEAGDDSGSLVTCADIALYEAKARGKNTVVGFSAAMMDAAKRRAYLEAELRKAVDSDALDLAYQPQFDCRSGSLVGAEVLARWTHAREGAISPAEFIPIAENSELIVRLGRSVLDRACVAAATWNAGCRGAPVRVAVNVSARQLRHPGFVGDVLAAIDASGLAPSLLELELTESHLIANRETGLDVMTRLREAGVLLSIDDFGTGYSSLSYLHAFPVNTLKIDRSFIDRLPEQGQPIVTAILSMAHSFGLNAVAEGVEDPEQLAWLVEAGCDVVQGYLTGTPMPLEKFCALVTEHASAQRNFTLGRPKNLSVVS